VQEGIVSAAVVGAAVGAAGGGVASDRLGRRPVLLVADALFAAGAALMAAAPNVATLVAGAPRPRRVCRACPREVACGKPSVRFR